MYGCSSIWPRPDCCRWKSWAPPASTPWKTLTSADPEECGWLRKLGHSKLDCPSGLDLDARRTIRSCCGKFGNYSTLVDASAAYLKGAHPAALRQDGSGAIPSLQPCTADDVSAALVHATLQRRSHIARLPASKPAPTGLLASHTMTSLSQLHQGVARQATLCFENCFLKAAGKQLANTLPHCLQCNCQPRVASEAAPRVTP